MSGQMKAVVIREAGGPEVLRIEQLPIPTPAEGEVLIRVRAFGLNRSELFTRQGLSPNVAFPRVLGIEAVGEVVAAPGGEFEKVKKYEPGSFPKTKDNEQGLHLSTGASTRKGLLKFTATPVKVGRVER